MLVTHGSCMPTLVQSLMVMAAKPSLQSGGSSLKWRLGCVLTLLCRACSGTELIQAILATTALSDAANKVGSTGTAFCLPSANSAASRPIAIRLARRSSRRCLTWTTRCELRTLSKSLHFEIKAACNGNANGCGLQPRLVQGPIRLDSHLCVCEPDSHYLWQLW